MARRERAVAHAALNAYRRRHGLSNSGDVDDLLRTVWLNTALRPWWRFW